jgi:hypothetical protein
MRRTTLQAAVAWAVTITSALAATATSTLTPSAASLSFSYQVNASTLPTSQTLTIAATGTAATSILSVQVVSTPSGWLTVTPDTGRAPLGLSASVNPTGLAPGSYTGLITVNTVPAGSNPASVTVTLSVRNPAPTLGATSTSTNYTSPPPALTFSYTTADAAVNPDSSVINVASSGDTIPFSVTASAGGTGSAGTGSSVWARVNGANQTPSLKTSGVALSGSSVPITVTVDPVTLAALNPGSYTNTISLV